MPSDSSKTNRVYRTYIMLNLFHSVMLASWHQVHLKGKIKMSCSMGTYVEKVICRKKNCLC